jgi:hypothetical protein
VVLRRADEADGDARGAGVQRTPAPRGRGQATAPRRGTGGASVFGRRKDEGFVQWTGRLKPFGSPRYAPADWAASPRHLEADAPQPGKRPTQKSARTPRT